MKQTKNLIFNRLESAGLNSAESMELYTELKVYLELQYPDVSFNRWAKESHWPTVQQKINEFLTHSSYHK